MFADDFSFFAVFFCFQTNVVAEQTFLTFLRDSGYVFAHFCKESRQKSRKTKNNIIAMGCNIIAHFAEIFN